MAFADSISALLDTYTNCISLLKAFKHGQKVRSSDRTQHARLRKSLRLNRSLVARAFSSKLSESGNRLKKGDARAVSAVDQILNRLKKAIANLLRLSSQKRWFRLGLRVAHDSVKLVKNRRNQSHRQSLAPTGETIPVNGRFCILFLSQKVFSEQSEVFI
ncbi:hypothetical protein VTK26DRAFT_9442 [Humicola hyalothermophila]